MLCDIPAWVNTYVGKEFMDHGRGPNEFDCYGLVRDVLIRWYNVPREIVPESHEYYDKYNSCTGIRSIARKFKYEAEVKQQWLPVDSPESGDVVLLRVKGLPIHVGVVVSEGWFLHSVAGQGVTLCRLNSSDWRNRILGFYRPNREAVV